MNYLVVKAGGSGNIIESPERHNIPWLAYRRLRFSYEHFAELLQGVEEASARWRIALVPGGMGAYLFIELARQLGVSEHDTRAVACDIISSVGRMLIMAMRNRGVADVYESLVTADDDLQSILKRSAVAVVAPSLAYRSTDALAATVAARLSGARLILFKAGVPEYHVGFERPTTMATFTTSHLAAIAREFQERPGHNAILDPECIATIVRHGIASWLVNKECAASLGLVVDRPEEFPSTTIVVE